MENSIIELGKLTNEKGSFCDGDWVESKDQDPNGQVRLIQMADIGVNEYKNKSQRFLTEEKYHELKCTEIKPGDILISRMPDPIGRACIFPGDEKKCITVVDVAILRPDDSIVDRNWLCHIVNSPLVKSQIEQRATGTTRKRISGKNLKKIKIPLPPLATQKKIAAILDAADALRQKTRQIIQEYDQLAQAIFLDMFGDPVTNPMGWENDRLGELCGIGSSKRVFVNELVNKGIPFYRGTEVGNLSEGNKIKPSLFITKEHFEKLKRQTGVPKTGDLLLPSICPDGRIWRVLGDQQFYFKDGRVLWIKVDQSIVNSVYLRSLLKEIFHANYSNIASGTTFAELKIVALKKLRILLPPIVLQNQFAEKVTLIEQQKELAKKSLTESEDLFNALLQKAFKGELVKA